MFKTHARVSNMAAPIETIVRRYLQNSRSKWHSDVKKTTHLNTGTPAIGGRSCNLPFSSPLLSIRSRIHINEPHNTPVVPELIYYSEINARLQK